MTGSLLLAAALVFKGATVHTAAAPPIENGVVVVEEGRIVAVGGPDTPVPDGATVVDVTGKHLAPPFFSAASLVGLAEIGAVKATVDVTEVGTINPEARPDVAFNLDSETLPVARANGVLYAALLPSGSVLPGSVSVMALDGWTREDACVRCPAAVALEWPRMSIDRSRGARPPAKKQEKARDEALATIRRAFQDARAFRAAKEAEGKPGVPAHDGVDSLAALVPVLEGKVPLLVKARTKAEIDAFLKLLDGDLASEKVRAVLVSGEDAVLVAPELARRGIPLVVDGTLELPERSDDPYDAAFTLPRDAAAAGLLVAVTAGSGLDGAWGARNLPDHAARAAAYGLDRLEALRSITLNPARIYGVEDRIGSLEAGKDGSLAVWSGDPLEITSRLEALYLKGREVSLESRQTRLRDRYEARPRTGGVRPETPAVPAAAAAPSVPPR